MKTRRSSALAIGLMFAGVFAVYADYRLFTDSAGLIGLDFYQEHLPRMRYARAAFASGSFWPPAWYTRELLGAPFWANQQSFPFIPTRLVALLWEPLFALAPAVILSALLSAFFTYLYARSAGLGRAGAALAGWTFACAGFFAARVMAGHLPVLEAYPALPLLLWLNEGPATRARLWMLGLACGCTFLAGHPQLPLYAIGVATAYAVTRHGRGALRRVAAMVAGVGTASFALYPMVLLIGRSTRMEMLDRAANNSAFPLERLSAFLFPWADGYPATVPRLYDAYRGAGGDPLFWDTVCYVGWLPLLAVVVLGLFCVYARRLPRAPWSFLGAAGLIALVTATPAAHAVITSLHLTVLRSPARQLYVTAFALALAIGIAADRVRRASPLVLGLLTAMHVLDLGSHDAWFVSPRPLPRDFYSRVSPELAARIGDGRIAADFNLLLPETRTFDDVGFFDSLPLRTSYRGVTALAGSPPDRAEETLSAGAELPADALAKLCVHRLFTARRRTDLPLVADYRTWFIYDVPAPRPRAALRNGAPVTYRRPSSDRIEVDVDAARAGALQIVESYDIGWSARLNGQPAPVQAAEGYLLAVDVPAGRHRVELEYRTPGATTGALLSLASLVVLAGIASTAKIE